VQPVKDGDSSSSVLGYENYGNANRYGNIHGSGMVVANDGHQHQQHDAFRDFSHEQHPWSRHELAYVLTVDECIYQRVVREMGDAYRIPSGMYHCCRDAEGGDHVGISVAVVMLLFLFFLLVLGMIAWPSW